MPQSPRAVVLSQRLKTARTAKGHSVRALAAMLGWSASRLSRIENAHQGIPETDVSAVLALLGIIGTERDQLLRMVRELGEPTWWELQPGLSHQLAALIDAEQRATAITAVTPVLIPGLLQTRQYARSVIQADTDNPSEVEQRIAVRVGRQGILDKPDPVGYTAFIDEYVLARPIGGASVAAEQLHYLLGLARRHNIEINLLPQSAGYVPGLDGMWTLFDISPGESQVYIEGPEVGLTLDRSTDIARFRHTADRLSEVALSTAESVKVIATYARRFEEEESKP